MLNSLNLNNILFLDIETVPQFPSFETADEVTQQLWGEKSQAKSVNAEGLPPAEVYGKAGIFAEFGKIVCISLGYLHRADDWQFRLKSCINDDETVLLNEFSNVLAGFARTREPILCAHNGREFDFPYIARRMLINGLPLPSILDVAGKKPWEITFIDTMELWRFGDYKNFTSLKLLTHVFGIPSPKDDIDGSQVASVYWEEHDLPRIARYCEKDVVAIAQLLLRYKGIPLIAKERVVSATDMAH